MDGPADGFSDGKSKAAQDESVLPTKQVIIERLQKVHDDFQNEDDHYSLMGMPMQLPLVGKARLFEAIEHYFPKHKTDAATFVADLCRGFLIWWPRDT